MPEGSVEPGGGQDMPPGQTWLVSTHRHIPFFLQVSIRQFKPSVQIKRAQSRPCIMKIKPYSLSRFSARAVSPLSNPPCTPSFCPWIKPGSRVRKGSDGDLERPSFEMRVSCPWNERNKLKGRERFRSRGAERKRA